mmetsp:Transcript_32757/g.74900  ORF Transcript_32757/g.74900 Transcript_32757/m.74900 type:complete len:638 (-) Transcript_32757:148-2061(-)
MASAVDEGGRRASVGLPQSAPNPMATLRAAGSLQYQEDLTRHLSEPSLAHEKRQELREKGLIRYVPEAAEIPDVGGPLRRTKTGHILKNQAYFAGRRDQNKWDLPAHSGIATWRIWHGPRMRTDAAMMQKIDTLEAEQAMHEAQKVFVNTVRLQTLDRFCNQKLEHEQFAAAKSWAPHRKTKREVHDTHATFMADMDEKPAKELKKVFTAPVLKKDRAAVRSITQRMQVEETWKAAWHQWEQERRHDLIADLEDRRRHNTMLQYLSGQPVREPSASSSTRSLPNNCTSRMEELAKPRPAFKAANVTANTDFRGLVHVDHEHALEAMYPGYGHDLAVEFCHRATLSTQAGFPPPAPVQTPRKEDLKEGRQAQAALASADLSLEKVSVPVSPQRLDMTATRRGDEELALHAKAQFLPTRAPPAPDQRKTLMKEDWSPKATMNDPMRITGGFSRTDISAPSKSLGRKELSRSLTTSTTHLNRLKPSGEQTVPPTRDVVYPVITPSSPKVQVAKTTASTSFGIDGKSTTSTFGGSSVMSTQKAAGRRNRMNRVTTHASTTSTLRAGLATDDSDDEAQEEEDIGAKPMPRVCNFFGPPQATGERSRPTTGAPNQEAKSDEREPEAQQAGSDDESPQVEAEQQ